MGHKVSLAAIPAGGDVVKYGEVIGIATAAIEPGHHVHVQNVRSARLPARTHIAPRSRGGPLYVIDMDVTGAIDYARSIHAVINSSSEMLPKGHK